MEYVVSPAGRDENAGTREAPFRTLARAAAVLIPGDSCLLRGGVYHETLRPAIWGTAANPIVIKAYPGETPVISGADPVTDWRDEGNGLWSAPMAWDLADRNQLFSDGKPLTEARWPRTPNDADVMFHPLRAVATAGTTTTLTDPNLPGTVDAWTGALLWCAGGAKWICWATRITGFDPATHTLTFERDRKITDVAWYTPKEGSEYVIMGARAALGAPGEWWYDRTANRVWLCPPVGCAKPAAARIEAKRRLAAIDLRARTYIHIKGLHFRAGGLLTDADSAYLRLENLRGEDVAHSYAEDASRDAVVINGRHCLLFNCEFRNSSGAVLRVAGGDNRLVNCLIENGDYAGLWKGALALTGRRHVVRHNTVRHSGRDLLSLHGLTESVLEYNDLSYAGWLTHDLGITYGHDTDFAGTRIRFNHVHDCVAQGLAQGIYFDHCSHNVVVHDNLFWNIPDMPVQINNPSYFNLVRHNTAWQTNTRTRKIITFDHSHRNDLYGTQFVDNLFNAPFDLPANVRLAGNRIEPGIDAEKACRGAAPTTPAGGVPPPAPGDVIVDGRGVRPQVAVGGSAPKPPKAEPSLPVSPIGDVPRAVPGSGGTHGGAGGTPDGTAAAAGSAAGAAMSSEGSGEGAPLPSGVSGAAPLTTAVPLPWKAGRDAANPPDPDAPVLCPLLPGMNLLRNPMFERGTLEGWTAGLVGAAEVVTGNGWGNKVFGSENNAATGTSHWELRLTGNGAAAQAVTGVKPGQKYRLSGWLRVAATGQAVELVARDFGAAAAVVRCSTVEWMRLELDFTTGPAATAATIELRLAAGVPAAAQAWADNLGLVELE